MTHGVLFRGALVGVALAAATLAVASCGDDGDAASQSSSSSGGASNHSSTGADTSDASGSTATTGPLALPTGRFRIGAWCGPPADSLTPERMKEMADANFTNANFGCEGDTLTVEYNKALISMANDVGMDAAVWDKRIYDAANKRARHRQ